MTKIAVLPCDAISLAMLLEWLARRTDSNALRDVAAAIITAVEQALADPASRTADLGGRLGTRAFGEAVASRP